jgi:hypothetical protein
MSKKDKEKKKINVKRERYAKFTKEKPSTYDLTMPDLSDEQRREKREADMALGRFMKFNRNPPPHEVVPRKEKSKR